MIFLYPISVILICCLKVLGASLCRSAPDHSHEEVGEFDYVVVGAGSAGSVVAATLSRLALPRKLRVAILDAGQWEPQLAYANPGRIYKSAKELHDRFFFFLDSACERGHGRCWWNQQGRLLGGGAAINSQLYTRLAANDIPEWSPVKIMEAYETLEASMPRMLASPTWKELAPGLRTFVRGFQEAVPNLQWRFNPHEKHAASARISGMFRSQAPWSVEVDSVRQVTRIMSDHDLLAGMFRLKSRRVTPYDTLIGDPSHTKEGMHVFQNTTVSHVKLCVAHDGKSSAVGVVDGANRLFRARHEVVLSAGAYGTPKILYASGVTPHEEFPLRDHRYIMTEILYRGAPCSTEPSQLLSVFSNASNPNSLSPFASSEFEIMMSNGCCEGTYCIKLGLILLNTSSAGLLRVGSGTDRSTFRLVLSKSDIKRFEKLTRILQNVTKMASHFVEEELRMKVTLEPGHTIQARGVAQTLVVRGLLTNYNHPYGTLPMGEAVSARLQVPNVSRLRVADASVLNYASGHTDAAAQLVGYMAAAFMSEEAEMASSHDVAIKRALNT